MKQALHNEFSSIRALRAAIQKKDLAITEVVNSALGFAQQDKHNAFVDINTDATLVEAQSAQQNAVALSLAGVPIAHKDVFVTQGWRTTAASKMLGQYRSPFDATVVTKLKNAGAVSLGKLNCDEFAMGSSNENSAWGAVQNPWDLQAVAGGSSGGSAAAVAAGLVMAATGTDTGGSIRQPAAFCGISGIKPTYGCVSRFGMIAYASSLDQGGAFARSAEDLLEVLDVMAGFDERDSTSLVSCGSELNQEGRIRAQFTLASQNTTSQPLKGLRIGLPKEFFGEGVSTEVDNAIKVALKEFTALGAECVEISLPLTSYSIPAYYVIAAAEASTNLSRYDGVRYGHRAAEYGDLNDMISRSRGEAFGAEVQRRILMGTYVLSHGYYDAFYLQAQKIRRLIADDFQKALSQQCDVIMGPVAPTVAWNLGEKNNDPVAMYLADIFTLGASLSGLPTMSIPCGFGAEETGHGRRPVGLQIIGNYFSEGRLLALAHGFQQVTTWHQRRPTQEGQAS